ncbi:MAG TPA: hypothetical protein VF995_07540 [Actinomycetota bacterium]
MIAAALRLLATALLAGVLLVALVPVIVAGFGQGERAWRRAGVRRGR